MTQVDDSPDERRRSNFFNSFPIDGADEFGAHNPGGNDDDDDVAPPAYGELHDQIQLSQPGFEAGAAVTNDGRVNININQKNQRLADLLSSTIQSTSSSSSQPHQPQAQSTPDQAGPLPPAYIPPSLGGLPGQTPPPRLNVVIQIVGSRGDVQPFIALGQTLRDTYGHRVRVATHPTFRGFVEENGLEFFSIGGDPAELMAFMVKHPGLMPGFDAVKRGEIKRRREGIEEIVMGCWRSCIEAGDGMGPPPRGDRLDESSRFASLSGQQQGAARPFVADAIVANPPSFAHIHVAEKLGIPLHVMFTMPWSPTRAFAHPLANIESTNTDPVMTNYVSYALVEMMTWQGLGDVINRFRTSVLDLEPLSLMWAPGLLNRLRIPTTYCWSPALIPKPADWGPEVTVSGFFFLNLASSYTPDPDLAAFLAAGPPPVYIGFGSIVVEDPNALTRKIMDAVAISGVRALVSKGWGGLGADAVGLPEGVFMLGNCPHDWLFQHVAAVVHHGGAGTSAAGIKLGKPTVVVPFFGDQPFWGAMIAKAGAGPAPIPFGKLTGENLAAAIQEALKPETQARAQELGARIREEKGADVAGKSFHEFLNTDNMRCSLAPSRVAVWRVRRTKTRLSAMAAAVLVEEGLLKYSDLKLYRSIEYNTEDQPWDPITAVMAGLVGDLGTMAMAVGDFPREMFKGANWKRLGSDGQASKRKEGSQAPPDDRATAASASSTHLGSEAFSASQASLASSGGKGPAASTSTLPGTPTQQQQQQQQQPPSGSTPSTTTKPPSPSDDPFDQKITLETALGAGKGVSRVVGTGFKMPLSVCMGLARGFRNAPRLYSDDTVRPQEKVTDLASGLRVAGKEFGLGMYDGISGLVTQPLRGAQKGGASGLVKGFGKGIGGLIFKPAAAAWAVPAYTMQGVHKEVRKMGMGGGSNRGSMNHIVMSRVALGREEMERGSTRGERADLVLRWQAKAGGKEGGGGEGGGELKGFYSLKQKERERERERQQFGTGGGGSGGSTEDAQSEGGRRSSAGGGSTAVFSPPPLASSKPRWLEGRQQSFEQKRKKLVEQRDSWKKVMGPSTTKKAQSDKQPAAVVAEWKKEDEELELAIQASVQQTSKGDSEEDARVEAAIRESLREMREIAQSQEEAEKGHQGLGDVNPLSASSSTGAAGSAVSNVDGAGSSKRRAAGAGAGASDKEREYLTNITEEEYQALIEEAVKQSLAAQQQGVMGHSGSSDGDGVDEELLKALEASKVDSGRQAPQYDSRRSEEGISMIDNSHGGNHPGGEDEEEEMRRALEESEQQHREQNRQMTEEDIVLEYVKKQSLAEEEHRRRRQGGSGGGGGVGDGKGKEKALGTQGGDDGGEWDEEFRRALALSMEGGGGGPAGAGQAGESSKKGL